MIRLYISLITLMLIAVAYSNQAYAVDVKFNGEYFAAGVYLDKTSLIKDKGPSTAFYFQRLRLNTKFIVAPGLILDTRADIMKRVWGANRSTPGTILDTQSAGTVAENENIAFDLLYLTAVSPFGAFQVGYVIDGQIGTVFGDTSVPTPKIAYFLFGKGFKLSLQMAKAPGGENSITAKNPIGDGSDKDNNFYTALAIYNWKSNEAGLLLRWFDYRSDRNKKIGGVLPAGYKSQYLGVVPYAKLQLGPVAFQTEAIWVYGKAVNKEANASALIFPTDIDINQIAAWVDATADFEKFYIGATVAYMSGDDPSTKDKMEGNASGGLDWNPCLIMFNSERSYWAGSQDGYGYMTPTGPATTTNGGGMSNAYFAQLRAGVRPIEKLDLMASVSWAKADKTPAAIWESRDYGYEIDMTATYKITNNLSYMLGAGYWFVGDYYYGTSSAGKDLNDNFMIINKLTLSF